MIISKKNLKTSRKLRIDMSYNIYPTKFKSSEMKIMNMKAIHYIQFEPVNKFYELWTESEIFSFQLYLVIPFLIL